MNYKYVIRYCDWTNGKSYEQHYANLPLAFMYFAKLSRTYEDIVLSKVRYIKGFEPVGINESVAYRTLAKWIQPKTGLRTADTEKEG